MLITKKVLLNYTCRRPSQVFSQLLHSKSLRLQSHSIALNKFKLFKSKIKKKVNSAMKKLQNKIQTNHLQPSDF